MLWAEYQSFKFHNSVLTGIFCWQIASIRPYPSHNGAKALRLGAHMQHGATGPCSRKPHWDLSATLRIWSYLVIFWGAVLRSTRDIRRGFSHQWCDWHQVLRKNMFRRKLYVGGEYDVGNRQYSCYKELQCLEPCADLEEGSVQFATLPHSDFDYCPKSFCDYFAETRIDFCADPNIYIAANCEWTINYKASMTHSSREYSVYDNYGYDYSWSYAKGWLVMPPVSEDK